MDYVLKLSLQGMALTKIAITLWDQEDVMLPTEMQVWLKAEVKVIEKVQRLHLPEPLKKKLVKFISGIGWEIFKWREPLYEKYYIIIHLPSDLCWTPHGTVDTKKTAEAFIKNESIHVTNRYRLACNYCLEDDIPKLWNKIPEYLRKQFRSGMERDELVMFWTYHMNGELDKLDDEIERWGVLLSPQYVFEYAAKCGNKVATEYFLKRLTREETEKLLVRTAKVVAKEGGCNHTSHFSNVLCLLLSRMDERKQRETFKDHPHAQHVLRCLLEWPWQTLFIETVNRVWDFLSEKDLHILLKALVDKVQGGYRNCDYQQLFGELWQQSPNGYKKYVIDEFRTDNNCLLSALLQTEDIENVRLILKSTTVEERKDIIFSTGGLLVCARLVDTNKRNSLKIFLQEFLSSKEAMIEFKEELKERRVHKKSARPAKYSKNKYKWNKFFQLLDALIRDNKNKRSVEEAGESTSGKRIRSTEFEDVNQF